MSKRTKWINERIREVESRLGKGEYKTQKDQMEDLKLFNELNKLKDDCVGFFGKIDPNVLIKSGCSVACLLLILKYEKVDTIVSKGFQVFAKTI